MVLRDAVFIYCHLIEAYAQIKHWNYVNFLSLFDGRSNSISEGANRGYTTR